MRKAIMAVAVVVIVALVGSWCARRIAVLTEQHNQIVEQRFAEALRQ